MNKEWMRAALKKRRASISLKRRQNAAYNLFLKLSSLLSSYRAILSFATFRDEIDLTLLNEELAHAGRLVLPQVGTDRTKPMALFNVTDLTGQLAPNKWGLLEPIEECCSLVPSEEIDVVLVPGLGFDAHYHRIGYGKGDYDRLLKGMAPHCRLLGVGFKEQFVARLPQGPYDIPLQELWLF